MGFWEFLKSLIEPYDYHKAILVIFGMGFIVSIYSAQTEIKMASICLYGIFYGLFAWIFRNIIKDYRDKTKWNLSDTIYYIIVIGSFIIYLAVLVRLQLIP